TRWPRDWSSDVCSSDLHPLALDAGRRLDPRRQRAITRYYLDAGAGGLAVGVHTTQFAIRDAGLYDSVLELAVRTVREWAKAPPVDRKSVVQGESADHRR